MNEQALDYKMVKRIINIITKNCFTMKFNMFVIDSVERGLQEFKENPFVVSYSLDASGSEIMIDSQRFPLQPMGIDPMLDC